MKKLLLLIITCAFAQGVYAQEAPAATAKTTSHKHADSPAKYRCPKCEYSATERGDCPTDHVALIKDGSYYCTEHNNEVSAQPGKCSKCHKKLTKMAPKA
ncbi:hypothetical protein C3K47_18745 [Solitalea longa]|uniref:Uncharacterized protein n=1 Tax=Solitalea longa TaxID=2079460 RepID=A0A2S4ZY08_9SPHI|nr:hypothetical protein [Solitalea longa]POY34773.1 hypothetical protein C3K47_18745 [Solitalea longa]